MPTGFVTELFPWGVPRWPPLCTTVSFALWLFKATVPWETVANRGVRRGVPMYTAVNAADNRGEVANSAYHWQVETLEYFILTLFVIRQMNPPKLSLNMTMLLIRTNILRRLLDSPTLPKPYGVTPVLSHAVIC